MIAAAPARRPRPVHRAPASPKKASRKAARARLPAPRHRPATSVGRASRRRPPPARRGIGHARGGRPRRRGCRRRAGDPSSPAPSSQSQDRVDESRRGEDGRSRNELGSESSAREPCIPRIEKLDDLRSANHSSSGSHSHRAVHQSGHVVKERARAPSMVQGSGGK